MFNDSSNEASKLLQKNGQTTKNKCNQNNSIKFEAESIKSCLCDYSDAFILVTGDITVTSNNDTDIAFKNCAPFSAYIQKLMMFLLIKQIMFTLQCLCTI